ncbi:polyamine-transporting ATPase 13A3-like [Dunckerocampus dactyliophorus]|uniref:polyamine-transporting ATPase 13A3-like n=1 Tax=Dunckerocampus dactyliophorus TaxID=161453 RepID=UPI0024057558|nr:polyamine-transporting ATPase 13A3-like [Dunckerocampus dactyliophorus]
MKTQQKFINQGQEDEMEVWGYRPCLWKIILVGIGAVCSGGLLLLLLYWLPQWGVKATCTETTLKEARRLLLRTTDDFRQWFRAKVHVIWAPGKTPFDSVEFTAHLQDGDEHQSLKAEHKKQNGKLCHRACVKVHYFTHHNIKYYWNEGTQSFSPYKGLEDTQVSCAHIHTNHSSGLTKTLQDYRALFFGKNEIDVKVPSLFKLLVNEVLNPFYVFQVFAVIVWSLEDYYHYALAMLLMSAILLVASLWTIKKHYVRLRDTVVAHSMVQVSVCRRNEDIEQVMSTELVPGDVITIPTNGMIMPCDAVLVCGACTVDESMLTGESVPVTKTSVPSSGEEAERMYNAEEHKLHTLFCGSHVIQSRYYAHELVKVVVVRTGFSTEKGQLVRSILYPKPTDFKLYRDATHFLMCMVGFAVVCVIYSIVNDVLNELPTQYIIFDCVNIVTIAVAPILPVALTAGLVNAQRRMKRAGIFCISPQRINIAGQVNLVCFDKTGTLTEDSLNLWGIQRAEDAIFSPPETEVATESLAKTSFFTCMATCHSLVTIDNKLCGDPLDLKVFSATGLVLEEPTEEHNALYSANISTVVRHPQQVNPLTFNTMTLTFQWGGFGIVRHFPFSSTLKRMSVLVRQLGQRHFDVYLKGAPQTVANLCKPDTVPESFGEMLESYTRQGFRVIALAHHQLESSVLWPDVQNLSRQQLETNMYFLGLIIMQNKIKEQSAGVLLDLRQANIRTVMATGDNMLTAISVARDCGMVQAREKVIIADAVPPNDENPASITWRYSDDPVLNDNQAPGIVFIEEGVKEDENPGYHFAVSGRSFAVISEHFPELVQKFLLRATVFAQMTPDQKTQLVQVLQSIDYIVGMCGDGANDCGALKKAHCGISLSELEASVASPFTSSIPNISCVSNLIREGRAALVTSFCVFKFIALNSIIQTFSIILLYSVLSSFGSLQFLCIDIGTGLFLPFTMSLNPAWKKLVRHTPPTNLKSGPVVFSVLAQILNCLLFQLLTFFLVRQQSWYTTFEPVSCHETRAVVELKGVPIKSFENTSIFFVSSFQCLIVAIVYSKGKPFRQPSYKNWPFMLTCAVLYVFFLVIMLHPITAIDNGLLIVCIPYDWRIKLLIIVLGHTVVSFTLEILILDTLWMIVKANLRAKPTNKPPNQNTAQVVNGHWGWAFLSWMICCKQCSPKTKYKHLTLKLQEQADWPPAPSTITYASTPQSLTYVSH